MSSYETKAISDADYKTLISLLRAGYKDNHGVTHRPNNQVADILVLEANLGCRLSDIINLTRDSIINDGGIWKLNIIEQKTGKRRCFIVPQAVKKFIDGIESTGSTLFKISEQAVWKVLRQVTEYMGLDKTSSHSFRKYASLALYESSGHDLMLVSQWLQHSSPKVTATYLKRSSQHMENAINNIVNLA